MLFLALAVLQQVPTIQLDKPTAAPDEPFTMVNGLAELPDGRVLVADWEERRLVLLDPRTSRVQALSRVGEGPREFRRPSALLPRPGGGAWLWDQAQSRLLPINPDGSLSDVIPLPPVTNVVVSGVDRQGRIYAVSVARFNGTTRTREDSVWVMRWTPPARTVDTLMMVNRNGSSRHRRIGDLIPVFLSWDAYTLLPNGDIVTLDAATYRVNIWRDGRRIVTNLVPWNPVPVTSDEKRAFVAGWEGLRTLIPTGPQTGAPRAAPQQSSASDFDFPAFKSPFVDGAVYGASDDRIWMQRTTAHSDSLPLYDILDATGHLLGRVRLPLRAEVLGFGKGVVYLGEKNDDDEIRLRRYTLPRFTP